MEAVTLELCMTNVKRACRNLFVVPVPPCAGIPVVVRVMQFATDGSVGMATRQRTMAPTAGLLLGGQCYQLPPSPTMLPAASFSDNAAGCLLL